MIIHSRILDAPPKLRALGKLSVCSRLPDSAPKSLSTQKKELGQRFVHCIGEASVMVVWRKASTDGKTRSRRASGCTQRKLCAWEGVRHHKFFCKIELLQTQVNGNAQGAREMMTEGWKRCGRIVHDCASPGGERIFEHCHDTQRPSSSRAVA